jgi:hypothetical protein
LRTPRSLMRPRLLRPPGPLADEFPAGHTSQLTLVERPDLRVLRLPPAIVPVERLHRMRVGANNR